MADTPRHQPVHSLEIEHAHLLARQQQQQTYMEALEERVRAQDAIIETLKASLKLQESGSTPEQQQALEWLKAHVLNLEAEKTSLQSYLSFYMAKCEVQANKLKGLKQKIRALQLALYTSRQMVTNLHQTHDRVPKTLRKLFNA